MAKLPSTEDLLLTYSFGIIFSQCLKFWEIHLFDDNELFGFVDYTQACGSFVFLIFAIFHGRMLKFKLTVMESLVTFAIILAIDKVFDGRVLWNGLSKTVQLLLGFYSILMLLKIVQKSTQHRYVRVIEFPEDVNAFLEHEYPTYPGNLIFIWLFHIRGLNLQDMNIGHASMQLAADVDRNYNYISNWPSNPSNPLIRENWFSTDVPSHPSHSLSDDIAAEGDNPQTIICIPENIIHASDICNWFRNLRDNDRIIYNLMNKNCTYFIRSALLEGGLELLKPWVGVSVTTLSFSTDLATHVADTLAYRRGNFWLRLTYQITLGLGFCKLIFLHCMYLQVVFYMLYKMFPNYVPVQQFPFYHSRA